MERTIRAVIGSTLTTTNPLTAIGGTRANLSPKQNGYLVRFKGTDIIPPQIKPQRCGGIHRDSTRVWPKAEPVRAQSKGLIKIFRPLPLFQFSMFPDPIVHSPMLSSQSAAFH